MKIEVDSEALNKLEAMIQQLQVEHDELLLALREIIECQIAGEFAESSLIEKAKTAIRNATGDLQ